MRQVSSKCFYGKSLWFCILSVLLLVAMLAWTGCSGSTTTPGDGLSGGKDTLAKGGNGGGGGGGGKPGGGDGDPPPAADPAIVYSVGGNRAGLKVMNADGSNQTEVWDTYVRSPNWSPAGDKFVFTHRSNGYKLYTINLDGSGLFEVFGLSAFSPAWSPDPVLNRGDRIVFHGRPASGGMDDIHLISPSGDSGTLENLTNTADKLEGYATWSSDATRLAYVRAYNHPDGSGPRFELWIHDFTTETPTQVIMGGPFSDTATYAIERLDWARTQDKIAFEGDATSSTFQIWVVDLADPANPVQLTNDPNENCMSPSWSADDSEIVYSMGGNYSNDYQEIWKMNADGSGKTLLVQPKKGLFRASYPDWKR